MSASPSGGTATPAAGSGGKIAVEDQAGTGGAAAGEGNSAGTAGKASRAGAGGDAVESEAGAGAEAEAGAGAGAGSGGAGAEAAGAGGESDAGAGGSGGMQPSAAGAGRGAGAGGAGMSAMPECTNVGAVRCSPQDSSKRQRCSDGMWRDAEPCGEDQICAGPSMGNPGSCVATADVCRNRNGRSACDDAGMLYQCGDGGVVRGMMRCGSRELCMPGETTGTCGKCVPGEYRCTGMVLERCDAVGTGFYETQRCSSPELCRADKGEGMCDEATCNPGQKTCMGDILQECRPDRTGFQRLRECDRGQCDATAGTCRMCMPGAMRCVGSMLMACDAQGSRETVSKNCAEICEGDECQKCDVNRCVECVGDQIGSCGVSNQGECVMGSRTCRDGRWSQCSGNKDPKPESCNGKDDDCDGMFDNDVTDCPMNQVCMNNMCRCLNADGCQRQQGEICMDGRCVRPQN